MVARMQLVLTLFTTASTNVGRACGTPGARKPSPIRSRPEVRTHVSNDSIDVAGLYTVTDGANVA